MIVLGSRHGASHTGGLCEGGFTTTAAELMVELDGFAARLLTYIALPAQASYVGSGTIPFTLRRTDRPSYRETSTEHALQSGLPEVL
jgi:hypothetical protein